LLYDDLSEIHRRTAAFVATLEGTANTPEAEAARSHLGRLTTNLNHTVDSLLEVLARMDVRRVEPVPGKLDKINQRVLSVEPASSPEDDLMVTASVKPGFLWRERTVRAEEVTVKKWRPDAGPVTGPIATP
jgi:molecular chaperone GrpE (heat shock protein)